jgi:hypothetical protein
VQAIDIAIGDFGLNSAMAKETPSDLRCRYRRITTLVSWLGARDAPDGVANVISH